MRRALRLIVALVALLVWGGVGVHSASAAWLAGTEAEAVLENAAPVDEPPDAPVLPDTDGSAEDVEVMDDELPDDPGVTGAIELLLDASGQRTFALRAAVTGSPGDRAEPATRPPRVR